MGNLHSSRGLSREEAARAKMRFQRVTSKDQPFLSKRKFADLLGNSTYAEGLFNLIDTDGDGTVSCKEMCDEIKLFRASKTPGSKLRELAGAMRVACGEELSDSQLEKLVHSVMESFDVDKDGFLNFKEFCCLMHNVGLQYNL